MESKSKEEWFRLYSQTVQDYENLSHENYRIWQELHEYKETMKEIQKLALGAKK